MLIVGTAHFLLPLTSILTIGFFLFWLRTLCKIPAKSFSSLWIRLVVKTIIALFAVVVALWAQHGASSWNHSRDCQHFCFSISPSVFILATFSYSALWFMLNRICSLQPWVSSACLLVRQLEQASSLLVALFLQVATLAIVAHPCLPAQPFPSSPITNLSKNINPGTSVVPLYCRRAIYVAWDFFMAKWTIPSMSLVFSRSSL